MDNPHLHGQGRPDPDPVWSSQAWRSDPLLSLHLTDEAFESAARAREQGRDPGPAGDLEGWVSEVEKDIAWALALPWMTLERQQLIDAVASAADPDDPSAASITLWARVFVKFLDRLPEDSRDALLTELAGEGENAGGSFVVHLSADGQLTSTIIPPTPGDAGGADPDDH